MIQRLLPFVERNLNLIELAPPGTGKSYLFGQISRYGWLVSGKSTRAQLIYNKSNKREGVVAYKDYVSPAALSAMEPFLTTEFHNPSTKYSAAIKAHKAIEKARVCIAECIGAEPSEIYFTSGGTESDNWAIKGTMLPLKRSHGIISSEVEHHAVLNSCSFMERIGYPATYSPSSPFDT